MINKYDNIFKIDTKETTYIIRISKFNHVLNDYYGAKINDTLNFDFSQEKYGCMAGTTVYYSEEDVSYVLDMLSSEITSVGKGDYKEPSILIDNGNDYILDLVYQDYKINSNIEALKVLPSPHSIDEELIIFLKDKHLEIYVELHYLIGYESNVIARNVIITNKMETPIHLEKVMSMNLEMVGKKFELVSLYGGWGFEGQKNSVVIDHGIYINDSKTGN